MDYSRYNPLMPEPGEPLHTDPPAEPEVFDLSPPIEPVKPVRRKATVVTPVALAPMPAMPFDGVAVPAPAPVLPYARAAPGEVVRALDTNPEFQNRWRDLWIPVALLTVAVGVLIAVCFDSDYLLGTLLAVSTFVVIKAIVMVVAVPAMTKFADVSFGRYAQAMLKLAAVGLLPDAAAASVMRWADACSGVLLSIPAAVMTGWIMLRFLFDFDFAEAMWCTVVLTVITLVPYVLWWQLFWKVMEIAG
jgi:hypothetical protein